MKTAEEIASETLRTTHSFPIAPSGLTLRALMAQAIEADRAQRPSIPTEAEWKQTPEYINAGDWDAPIGTRYPVIVQWGDPTETPTEAVTRLNGEAVENAERADKWEQRALIAEGKLVLVRNALEG